MNLSQMVGIALLVGAGSAAATDMNSDATSAVSSSEFNTIDANEDGQISRSEAEIGGMTDYVSADRNGDGLLDRNEFTRQIDSTPTMSKQPHSGMDSQSDMHSDDTRPGSPDSTSGMSGSRSGASGPTL